MAASSSSIAIPDLKLLAAKGMHGAELRDIVLKKLRRSGLFTEDGTLRLTVGGSLLEMDTRLSELYDQVKAEGGFLQVTYSTESL